jgi:hypothetical protein
MAVDPEDFLQHHHAATSTAIRNRAIGSKLVTVQCLEPDMLAHVRSFFVAGIPSEGQCQPRRQ